jgi:hypothetical protein
MAVPGPRRSQARRTWALASTRIDGEPDVSRLESWLEAAVTASSIADVFRDG